MSLIGKFNYIIGADMCNCSIFNSAPQNASGNSCIQSERTGGNNHFIRRFRLTQIGFRFGININIFCLNGNAITGICLGCGLKIINIYRSTERCRSTNGTGTGKRSQRDFILSFNINIIRFDLCSI